MNTFSDRLNQLIKDDSSLNPAKIQKFCAVGKSTVSKWRNGETEPKARPLLKLSWLTNKTPEWLIFGERDETTVVRPRGILAWDGETPLSDDEVAMPIYTDLEIAAGDGVAEGLEIYGPKIRFAKSTLRRLNVPPESGFFLRVDGDSMYPEIADGATVGINTASKKIRDGKIYAVSQDGLARLKSVFLVPGGYRLHSLNDQYPDETTDLSLRIIGQLFWAAREYPN